MAMPRFVFQLVWLIVTIRCFDKCNKQNRRRRFCLFACFVLDLHCWCFGARKIALASAKFSSGVTKRFGRWNFWRFENFATSQNACQKTATKQQQRFMWWLYPSLEGLPRQVGGRKYMCIGVGLSVLLVSTSRGNAKAFKSWSERAVLHAFGFLGVMLRCASLRDIKISNR